MTATQHCALWAMVVACASVSECAVAQSSGGGGASGGGGGGVAIDSVKQELLKRIADLEAKSARDEARNAELESRIASLEQERGADWLTEQRAEQIRMLVQDALADADTRASMLTGITAGYDDGFVLSSADGNWLLRTNLLMQQRLVLNFQDESPDDKTRWGFENSRTRFTLSGNVISPDWFYKAEIELSRADTGLPSGQDRRDLLDAYAGYDFGQGWRFWVGTFKAPILREELIDSSQQLAVERSVVNYVYTGGYTDGIAAEYRNAMFHVVGSYNNGINDQVYGGGIMTGGNSPIFNGSADVAITFRGEWLITGAWDQLEQFTSPRGNETAMMLGGAVHYQAADSASTGVPDLDLVVLTLDFTGQFSGLSVFGAIVYANVDQDGVGSADAFGLVLQGGWYFAATWEVFARYEWSDTDQFAASDINIVTFGVNKYIARQNAKWTTDFGVGFDAVPFAVPIAAWRADEPDSDHQFVVRSQLQIMF